MFLFVDFVSLFSIVFALCLPNFYINLNHAASVPLLESLDRYERAKISDALIEVSFQNGEFAIRQGDPGDNFYIVEEVCSLLLRLVL